MPVKSCQRDGKPGFQWGDGGTCYTYAAGDAAGRAKAREKATKQGQAIAFRRAKERGTKKPTGKDFD